MHASTADAAKVLIADTDPTQRLDLAKWFAQRDFRVRTTGPAATLLKWIDDPQVVLAVLDVSRAGRDGLEVLAEMRRRRPLVPVILTGVADLAGAVQAVEAGAFDHFPKPYATEALGASARRALLIPKIRDLTPARPRAEQQPIIGRSLEMQALYRRMARLVRSDVRVLISGETGTGKALIARALHDMGPRRDRPFVALSPATMDHYAIAAALSAQALLEAKGGTVFLDTVDSLPPEAQAALLALLDGPLASVGAAAGRPDDIRFVTATSRDLRGLARRGAFREDLYFRLNVAKLTVPALRGRPDDVADLVHAFLRRAEREGSPAKTFDGWAIQRLKSHDWPGNVRELENLVRRICALHPERVISADIVDHELREQSRQPAYDGVAALNRAVTQTLTTYFTEATADRPGSLYDHILKGVELPMLQATLQATRGNKLRAAKILGINRSTLQRKLESHGLGKHAARPVETERCTDGMAA